MFWEIVGLERGPLSLVSTIEELLGRKSRGSGLKNRGYGLKVSNALTMRLPLYPQKLALTSPSSGGRSVGIVSSRTQATWKSLGISGHMPMLHQILTRFCVFRFIPPLRMGTSLTQHCHCILNTCITHAWNSLPTDLYLRTIYSGIYLTISSLCNFTVTADTDEMRIQPEMFTAFQFYSGRLMSETTFFYYSFLRLWELGVIWSWYILRWTYFT
jgi:hypothetical protein